MATESFRSLLGKSARLLKRQLDTQLKFYDITTTQWALLKILSQHDSLTQAEIALKLASDRATVGSIIDRLIDRQLISKHLSPNDRRAYKVKISDSGIELMKKATEIADNCCSNATDGLSEEEIQIFRKCLSKIISNLHHE